jgi:hypothetical protein
MAETAKDYQCGTAFGPRELVFGIWRKRFPQLSATQASPVFLG